ncbi:MAG TPA: aspartate/glutamate racemase family protein [Vicinamibacteria bacterium]|nr:aspartate/glutamate racemase family protein [Vicinamibacteria bacterium]
MRILYLVPGPMKKHQGQAELDRRRAFLERHASAGTDVEIWDTEEGPASIESMVEEHLAIPHALKAVARAEREGISAVILGCFGDPGLDAARELVSIPVIGPYESSLLVSLTLGHRTSVITVLDSVVPSLEAIARARGLESRLASVRSVQVPVLDLAREREGALRAFVEEGRRAIREDRADVLVPGCMSMAFLGIAESAQSDLRVPVLNPAVIALKLAELQVSAGITHSKNAFPFPPKKPSLPT